MSTGTPIERLHNLDKIEHDIASALENAGTVYFLLLEY